MRLFAAILPPPEVLDELAQAVRAVIPDGPSPARSAQTASSEGQHAGPRKGLLGRLGTRPALPEVVPEAPADDQVKRLLPARMTIPLTSFGNLTRVDAELIGDALRQEAVSWKRPSLCFTGGTALDFPGDRAVWVGLAGDVGRLEVIAQHVPRVVQRLSLFVDRRSFRPWLAVGTITDTTTAPYLEQLVAALTSFRGTRWTQDAISLMSGQPEAGPDEPFHELERIPLAPD